MGRFATEVDREHPLVGLVPGPHGEPAGWEVIADLEFC